MVKSRAVTAQAYLEQVRNVVTPQRFAQAVDQIFRKAEASGDLDAFRAVAPYVVGPMRLLEDTDTDDTITRIIAVVERRREVIGERKVLEGPVEDTVDGEYTEVKEIDHAKTTQSSAGAGTADANADSSADGEGVSPESGGESNG